VLRNLKALQELRGPAGPLTVANYGQINVGQTQTNQAGPPARARRRGGRHAGTASQAEGYSGRGQRADSHH
jgi:hypothetical protein